mmetsp:Transcript_8755/g.14383  ORF Transcript_8755/g.14383 Transcript_8755/m.14383 type:complete len:101 (+) Transcript_8755:1372-1674(+)
MLRRGVPSILPATVWSSNIQYKAAAGAMCPSHSSRVSNQGGRKDLEMATKMPTELSEIPVSKAIEYAVRNILICAGGIMAQREGGCVTFLRIIVAFRALR